VGLHAGIGCLTPDDEHHGCGEAIRQARRDGLARARAARIAYRRNQTEHQTMITSRSWAGYSSDQRLQQVSRTSATRPLVVDTAHPVIEQRFCLICPECTVFAVSLWTSPRLLTEEPQHGR
jgi:hypothetical protein